MKHEIIFSNWHNSCGDGCCSDYGSEIYVNGVSVTRYYTDTASSLQLVLEALGIDATITEEWDDYDTSGSYQPEDQYEDDEEF